MAAASTAAYRKSKTIRRASKIDDFVLTPKIPVGDRRDDSDLLLDEKLRKLLNGVPNCFRYFFILSDLIPIFPFLSGMANTKSGLY
jgi:hypothetical protein